MNKYHLKTPKVNTLAVGYDAGKKIKGRKRFMTVDTLGKVTAGVGYGNQCGGA